MAVVTLEAVAQAGIIVTCAAVRTVDVADITFSANAKAKGGGNVGTVGFIKVWCEGIIAGGAVAEGAVGTEPFRILTLATAEADVPRGVADTSKNFILVPPCGVVASSVRRFWRKRPGVAHCREAFDGDTTAVAGAIIWADPSLARVSRKAGEAIAASGFPIADAFIGTFRQRMGRRHVRRQIKPCLPARAGPLRAVVDFIHRDIS